MEITSTAGSGASASPYSNSAASDGSGSPIIASDFNTFIQMLTTQARYQDPLEPIDSSEYAAQLAQFSMVEQQVRSNSSLSAIAAALSESGLASFSGWVGMEARSTSAVYFDGTPVSVAPTVTSDADSAVVVVQDQMGQAVQRVPVSVSDLSFEWSGTQIDGTLFAPGSYRFLVESYSKGNLVASHPAEAYGRIDEARLENGTVVLILEGGQAIQTAEVTGLRDRR
jgi:flagellar basal-body rod modification protein FlgD